jgi:hypothetical protein
MLVCDCICCAVSSKFHSTICRSYESFKNLTTIPYMMFVRSQQCCGQSAPAGHIGAASAAGPSADLPLSRATGFPARETGSGPAVPAHTAATTLGPGYQLQNVSVPTRSVFCLFGSLFRNLQNFAKIFLSVVDPVYLSRYVYLGYRYLSEFFPSRIPDQHKRI